MKVLFAENVHPAGPEYLKNLGYEISFLGSREPEEFKKAIADCDAVVVRVLPMPRDVIQSGKKLKMIAKHGVGMDNIDMDAAKELGIAVMCTPGANSLSVAEQTMALLLACAKQIPYMAAGYRASGYECKNGHRTSEITGKTLGVIGAGRIGSIVARMAALGFGMRVLIYDPYLSSVPDYAQLCADRDEVFRQADYLSLHLPLEPATRHSVGAREFKLMKNTAVVLNCARGPILDEQALIAALEAGELGGAGLDVSEPEPMQKDNPLFSMPNVICTPHTAAATEESMERVVMMDVRGIDEYLTGKNDRPEGRMI